MCEPLTLAAAGVGLVGSGISAVGQLQAGEAAEDAAIVQAEYQEQVARNNAILAAEKARTAEQRGAEEEVRISRRVNDLRGRQRAAFAANGFVLDEGSAMDTLVNTAMLGQMDASIARENAEAEANGFVNMQNAFIAEAQLFAQEAENLENVSETSVRTAFATILGGSATAFGAVSDIDFGEEGGFF